MIRYNKKIFLEFSSRSENWKITTDRSDTFEISAQPPGRTMVTNWWEKQYKSDLRLWQKDLVISEMGRTFGPLQLFTIYKKNQGYTQHHDLCLSRNERHQVWILSTTRDFWIQKSDQATITFDLDNSLGSILDQSVRFEIGEICDNIREQINPDNICQWTS
jgi:hypothetical protein